MIESFKHKGLRELFVSSTSAKLPAERLKKIKMILTVIHNAVDLKDLNAPGFRLHKLKKPPLDGYYSIDVSGNFRIVFCFENGKASEVDYLDTH